MVGGVKLRKIKGNIRTDLACEAHENIIQDKSKIHGVLCSEKKKNNGIVVNKVSIVSENGAKKMGRPKGDYITVYTSNMLETDSKIKSSIVDEIACILQEILGKCCGTRNSLCVLVVGLGNEEITPDALGPFVLKNVNVTRHIFNEFGESTLSDSGNIICGISPGVMAQTGMETLEIVRGISKEIQSDCIIIVDALAARSVKRLFRTIQFTDVGIIPGSGVGNHRNEITHNSVGVPVISIGVPTVIDAFTMVSDVLNKNRKMQNYTQSKLNGMFVTPKDIDEEICVMGEILAEGINKALK